MPFVQGTHYTFHRPKETSARPPLILIHGAGGCFLSWHPYLRRLDNETVYTLDLPGHGRSKGTGRQSIEEYANDILCFIESLTLQKAIIAGHSMGGAMALTLALDHPEKLAALMLFGTGAKLRVSPTILEMAKDPHTYQDAVEMTNTYCFSVNAPPDLVELSRKNMMKLTPSAFLGDFQACDQFDITDKLSEINLPTLILCGKQDVMTPPKYSQFLNDIIQNSEIHLIADAGHMIMLEKPDEVANLMKQFLDSLPPLS